MIQHTKRQLLTKGAVFFVVQITVLDRRDRLGNYGAKVSEALRKRDTGMTICSMGIWVFMQCVKL